MSDFHSPERHARMRALLEIKAIRVFQHMRQTSPAYPRFCHLLYVSQEAQMYRNCTLLLLYLFASVMSADAAPYLFDGFYLGMSKVEATKIHPEVNWMMIEPLMLIDGRRRHGPTIVTKEFTSLHLGKVAKVIVTLNKKAQYVHTINYVFSSTSSAECIGDAAEMSALLKQTYGIETKIIDSPPDRHSMWITKDNSVVVWQPYCDYAPAQFRVTYSKDGG